jgi:putative ABC transport system ATP-binding protein
MTTLISLTGIVKTYHLGQTLVPALRGLDLVINKSEFTAVVGASGSGKSTLLNVVGCIDEPDEGEVLFDGVDVRRLDDDGRCALRNRKIGYVFQTFNLMAVLSAEENVELPLLLDKSVKPAARRERVRAALADVELEGLARNLPDQLSGGQRQRVAIARALAVEPDLVLADEPTANLDSETAQRIVDLMIRLNERRQVTFLFSTHDERLMKRVSRVVHLQDGRIVGEDA